MPCGEKSMVVLGLGRQKVGMSKPRLIEDLEVARGSSCFLSRLPRH